MAASVYTFNAASSAHASNLFKEKIADQNLAIPSQISEEIEKLKKLLIENKYEEANIVAISLLKWHQTNLGEKHTNTLEIIEKIGELYLLHNQPKNAEVYLLKSLEIKKNSLLTKDITYAETLAGLGQANAEIGKDKKALAYLEEAYSVLVTNDKLNNELSFIILDKIGEIYTSDGFFSSAEKAYKQNYALQNKIRGADNPLTTLSILALYIFHIEAGDQEQANKYFEIIESNPRIDFESIENFADKLFHGEEYKLCSYILQVIAQWKRKYLSTEDLRTGITYYKLSQALVAQELYEQAKESIGIALPIFEKTLVSDRRSFLAVIVNLSGAIEHKLGNHQEARQHFEKALEIRIKTLGPKHPSTADSLNNLATAFENAKLYEEAEPLFKQALGIFQELLGKTHEKTGSASANLARIYQALGRDKQALDLMHKALDIRRATKPDKDQSDAVIMHNIASIYEDLNDPVNAKYFYEQALKINKKELGEDHLDTIRVMNSLGNLYRQLRDYGRAEELLLDAVGKSRVKLSASHPLSIALASNLYGLYKNKGDENKALDYLEKTIFNEINQLHNQLPLMSRTERQTYLNRAGSSFKYAYAHANNNKRGGTLALLARLNRQGMTAEIEKTQAALYNTSGIERRKIDELRDIMNSLSFLSLETHKREELEARMQKIERQIYASLTDLKSSLVKINEVSTAMPSDSLLVEYQKYRPFNHKNLIGEHKWGDFRYMAMALKPDGSILITDLGDARVIDRAIDNAIKSIELGLGDSTKLLSKVRRLVFDPLQYHTSGHKTLFISPDGELNRLPFAALPSRSGKERLLSDEINLRLVTTGRELIKLQKPLTKELKGVLVLADPQYDKSNNKIDEANAYTSQRNGQDATLRSIEMSNRMEWKRLPATKKEGQAIHSLIGGKLLTGAAATPNAVKLHISPKILHLATHAFYLPNQAKKYSGQETPLLRSGIALAGANTNQASNTDDGYLTALEMSQLNLEGTSLVVISACDSGLGDIQWGEGVYGLQRAIAVAGARSSLLSLWKVDDDATAAFMTSFYTRLKAGMGRGDALSATQKEFRSHSNEDWREPYVWAAFQLSGDWGPIEGL